MAPVVTSKLNAWICLGTVSMKYMVRRSADHARPLEMVYLDDFFFTVRSLSTEYSEPACGSKFMGDSSGPMVPVTSPKQNRIATMYAV